MPSNPDRLQIIIRNDTSDSAGQTFGLVTTGIATGDAILGSIIGIHFTNKHNRESEERKLRKQEEKQQDFNKRIRELVSYELESYLSFLEELLKGEKKLLDRPTQFLIDALHDFPREYTKLPLEKRAIIFSSIECLRVIEHAYRIFDAFCKSVEYQLTSGKTVSQLKEVVQVERVKSDMEDAIKSIGKE